MAHTCDAIIITCIDFRFQKFIEEWERPLYGDHNFDRVAIAGGVYDFYTILNQVEISHKLHKITKVVLVNHEDCGAYGAEGTKEKHMGDLIDAEKKIEKLYPDLDVEAYYLHLDGKFEEVSRTSRHEKKDSTSATA